MGEHTCPQHSLWRLLGPPLRLVSSWAQYVALWTKVWTIVGVSLESPVSASGPPASHGSFSKRVP